MNRLLHIFLLIFPLLGCFSCEEPFPKLPEETQVGEQTFGCLVNNELVFTRNTWTHIGYVDAIYYIEADRLEITASCQFDQRFIFSIDHPQQGTELKLNSIRYLLPNSTDWIEDKDIGRIYLTRLDTRVYGVVSGTFSFELSKADKNPIRVTKGRFDLGLINYQ